ncbi:Nidogen-1 [Manis pentadactyla]|nr:Nidogen-1 [Manis pentadactyla]
MDKVPASNLVFLKPSKDLMSLHQTTFSKDGTGRKERTSERPSPAVMTFSHGFHEYLWKTIKDMLDRHQLGTWKR